MPCCSNPACTDLCGRWGAISIPTATLNVGILSWPDCDAEVAEGVGHGWGVRRQPQRVQNFGYRARKSMPAIAQVVFSMQTASEDSPAWPDVPVAGRIVSSETRQMPVRSRLSFCGRSEEPPACRNTAGFSARHSSQEVTPVPLSPPHSFH